MLHKHETDVVPSALVLLPRITQAYDNVHVLFIVAGLGGEVKQPVVFLQSRNNCKMHWLNQIYKDIVLKYMKVQLSKSSIIFVSFVALVFTGVTVFRHQNSATLAPDIASAPSPVSKIQYDFPIKNSVTYDQMTQFSGSVIGNKILRGRSSIETGDYAFNDKLSDYNEFNDGEVSYLELPNEPILTDQKEQLVTDPVESRNTVRIYSTNWSDTPLLRVSASSFDEVVKYEKSQLVALGFTAEQIKIHEVTAFGQKGVELEANDEVKYQDYFRLIVPLNGYIYVFYLHVSHDGQETYPIQSSFEFNNYLNK